MSRPNLKLAGEPPVRSPERETLAAAIERHNAALDTVRRVGQAREGADETVYRASDKLKETEKALKEAQAGEAAYLAAVALGENPGVSVSVAEAAVTRASNDLAVARRTRDALGQRAEDEAREVEKASEAIEKCIGAVVKAEVDVARLLEEAQVAQADLISKRVALRHLFNNDLVGEQEQPAVRQFLLFEYHLPTGRGQTERGNFDKHPANDVFKRAVEALREDADAELPSI